MAVVCSYTVLALVQESGKLSGLPPPPDEVGSKRKRRGAQDDMPSSLRHMLELKVFHE